MSQLVELSDELVQNAQRRGEVAERSVAGQIEYWAVLGRAVEPLFEGPRAVAFPSGDAAVPVSQLLASVDSPEGRQRVADYIQSRPGPHFEAAPGEAGMLVRVDADGTRTLGRIIDGQFRPAG